MEDVVNDLAYRVFKIRVWFAPTYARQEAGNGRICGLQVIYKHDSTLAMALGPVSGDTAAAGCTFQELTLFPEEQVDSVHIRTEKAVRMITITTNFKQELRAPVDAREDSLYGFSRLEFRAMHFVGSQFSSISVVSKSARNPTLPAVAITRFLDIKKKFDENQSRLLKLKEARRAKLQQDWSLTTARIFAVHGMISVLEAHRRVNTAEFVTQLSILAELHRAKWWTLTVSNSLLAMGMEYAPLPELETKLAELEASVKEAYVLDATRAFEQACEHNQENALYAIIQMLIDVHDEQSFDTIARLCLRTVAAFGLTELIVEQILAIRNAIEGTAATKHVSRKESNAIVLARTLKGFSALHAAAESHQFYVVELLLVHAQMDPVVVEAYSFKRPIDLIGNLSEQEANDEDITRILFLLDQCTKTREFQQRTIALLSSALVTDTDLAELVPNMTAVQDLQVIVSLGSSNLEKREFHQLLATAFQHVISNKLVFDDKACLYFKDGLKQCHAKGYITKAEHGYWKMKNVQVNMESAPWVTELKATIQMMHAKLDSLETNLQLLKTNFENLRRALVLKELSEQNKANRKQLMSVASLGLALAGVPDISALVEGVMDLTDPVQLLSVALELTGDDDVIEFCTTNGADIVFRNGFEDVLQRSEIEPLDFVAALKDAIIFEHPEFASQCDTAADVAGCVIQLALEEEEESAEEYDKECGPTAQDYQHQDLEDAPYHYVIQQSHGDFKEFLLLLEIAEEENCDVNEAHEVIVKLNSTSEYTRLMLPPYVFASYLGYADIVNHFRGCKDFEAWKGGERMLVTLNRARKNAQAACVA